MFRLSDNFANFPGILWVLLTNVYFSFPSTSQMCVLVYGIKSVSKPSVHECVFLRLLLRSQWELRLGVGGCLVGIMAECQRPLEDSGKAIRGLWVCFSGKLIGRCYRDDITKTGLNEAYAGLSCIAWLIKSIYWLFSWFWHIPESFLLKGISSRSLILFGAEIPLFGGKDCFTWNLHSIYRPSQVSYFLVNLATVA